LICNTTANASYLKSCVPKGPARQRKGHRDEEPAGHPSGQSATSQVRPAPATPSQQQEEPHDHDEHTAEDRESGLDAYIKELVDAAPPLTSEQRDTLALLLRRPRRK
jgi:hypothetical protein